MFIGFYGSFLCFVHQRSSNVFIQEYFNDDIYSTACKLLTPFQEFNCDCND